MNMNMNVLALSFWDNENLDSWEIPFGIWIEEIVFWLTAHISGFLDAVKWPVDKLLELIIDNLLQDWLPWPVVLLLFFAIGLFTRNLLVGLGSAAALLLCGLLGNDYWDLTMETVGMIIVAVIICTIIGIPLGIMAARIDAFWARLRPVLDGMQVIHPFVYLLPIIFLFGVRRTPGVLATLVFALPPIVRLTNLGVRQVPGDVVEAARAFGATELRVLREVQLPLARPAIMAGLNQTLLLSLSMVGIVAIIAGGGLGKPILTALNTADIPVGASAGAGLYMVGVLLDRISQPSDSLDRRNLFKRMGQAWANRKEPVLPAPAATESAPTSQRSEKLEQILSKPEAGHLSTPLRLAALTATIGGIAAIVSTLMTWGNDAGRISAYARFDDVDLPGAHSGLDATGGSWFGIVLCLLAVASTASGATLLWRKRTTTLADPAMLCALGVTMLAVVTAYLTTAPRGDNYSNGGGVWLALIAAALITALSLVAAIAARAPAGDDPVRVGTRTVIGIIVLAAFLILAGAGGSWILDQRSDAAQIAAEMAAQAEGVDQGGLAAEVLAEALSQTRRVTTRGLESGGPLIGYSIIIFTLLGTLASLGRVVRNSATQRLLGAVMLGAGAGVAAIGICWIASIVRLSPQALTPGASAFLAVCGGLVLIERGWRAAHPE